MAKSVTACDEGRSRRAPCARSTLYGLAALALSLVLSSEAGALGVSAGEASAAQVHGFVSVPASQASRFIAPDAPAQSGFEPIRVAAGRATAAVGSAKPSGVAGRYSILREGGKDTGCMLTLDDHTRGPGGNKAILAPACRDQGMVIFDPTGWQIVSGRLVLTARKGHTTHLDRQADGTWAKDPKEGKSLILKKQ